MALQARSLSRLCCILTGAVDVCKYVTHCSVVYKYKMQDVGVCKRGPLPPPAVILCCVMSRVFESQ